jgi:hypothetical protein
MTEHSAIEDRVRRTLRTVAEQPIPSGVPSFNGTSASARRPVQMGAVLIVAAVVVALVLALIYGPHSGSGTPRPASDRNSTSTYLTKLPDTALTPKGWSPLSLGAIQISVPSAWVSTDPGGIICGFGSSFVFIDQTPYSPDSTPKCAAPINVAELSSAGRAPLPHSRHATLNSIRVTESKSSPGVTPVTEEVRALGMQLLVKGPLAADVVKTITRSPLSVVLGSSVNSVPTGWRYVLFGGIRFAVPRQWAINRSTSWGGCPSNIEAHALVLSTARTELAPSCLSVPGTAGDLTAQPGMVLASGPLVTHAPADATCLRRSGLRICVDPPPSPTGGEESGIELNLFTAQISVPKQSAVDQIEIGLTGTGVTPLKIFDSMQPLISAHR